MEIRIALIGLGDVAQAHLAAIPLVAGARLVSLCDIRPEVVAELATAFGARAYTDYRALIEDGGVDLVMVLTPASTHREIVEAAAAAGIDVFCEKPLAITLADGEAMIASCEAASVRLFYGSCYRYLPAIAKAHDLIRSGAVGQVLLMSEQMIGGHGLAGYRQWPPVHYPIGGPGGPGMSLIDHGIHLLDVFSWFVGSEPISVLGQGQISGAPADSEFMLVTYPCGARGHLLYNNATFSALLPNEGMFSGGAGWTTDGSLAPAGEWTNDPGSISVFGTSGALRIFHYCNALFLNTGNGPKRIDLVGRPSLGHFATQLESCLDAIVHDKPPAVSGEQGIAVLRTLLPVYDSGDRCIR